MPKYLVYDSTTGEVKGNGFATVVPPAVGADRTLSDEQADRQTEYIQDPLGTPVKAARPPTTLTITPDVPLIADGITKVRVTGQTGSTDYEIRGVVSDSWASSDDPEDITFDTPGNYTLFARQFPERAASLEFTVDES